MNIVTAYALIQLYKEHGCASVFADGNFLRFEEETDDKTILE